MKQFRFPGFTFIMAVFLLGFAVTDQADAQGSYSGSQPSRARGGAYGSVRQSNYNSRGYSSSGLRSKYSSSGLRSNYSAAGMRSSGYSSRGLSSSPFDNEQYGSVRQAVRYTPGGLPLGDPQIESGDEGQSGSNIQIVQATAMAEPDSGDLPEEEPGSSQVGLSGYNVRKIIKQMPVVSGEQVTGGAVRIGSTISALPAGSQAVSIGNTPYYYQGGLYYQPVYVNGNWQYTVISPPVGTTFFELPTGWSDRTVGGVKYYTFDGVYYRPAYVNGLVGYVVAAAPE